MKNIYTLLLALLMTGLGFGQTTFYTESFETANVGYSFTANSGKDGQDFFEQTDLSGAPAQEVYTYAGFDGSFFIAGEDIDGIAGGTNSPTGEVLLSGIDISGQTSLEFTAAWASGTNIDIDATNDAIWVEVNIDGSGWVEIGRFESTLSSGSNAGFAEDTDGDFIGDGTALDGDFTDFTWSIAGTGSSMDVRISMFLDSGDEEGAFDNVRIAGISGGGCTAPTTQASAYNTTSLGSTSATLNWTSGDGDEVLVLVKEGSAVDADPTNGTSYTGNTAFSSGTELGTGNYAVYAGTTASSVSITGLTAATTYHVAVYEYNTTDTCYLTPALTGSFTTAAVTTIEFNPTSATVAEDAGTTSLTIEINNEDSTATTFDVVLLSGDAADIDSYTTQSETFPGSSTTDVTVTITITDDAAVEGDEDFTFQIQNVSGGNSAIAGTNDTFTLTITDNDAPTSGTLYDADFSNNGDGFPAHTTSSPPAGAPASAGPFGASPNQWTLSYTSTPSTDTSANSFEVVAGELVSDDWGGQGIFTSQSINVSGVSSVDISATGESLGNAQNGGSEYFRYFYIIDGGSRVETTVSVSSSGDPVNYSIVGLDVSSASTLEVGFEFSENGGGSGYNISEFMVNAGCTAPTTQASAYNTTSLGTTSATLNWTSGDGDEVLVLVKEGSAVDADPSNGTSYTASTTFTSGDQIGTGNYVVQSGSSASSVSVTGLNAATTYHVAVYEYNTTDTCYLTPALTGSFTTDCSTPSDVTAFTATSGDTTIDLSWANGICFDEILVVAKASSAVTNSPSGDGTAYTANAAFGSGTDIGSSEYVVYKGTGTSVTVTGLTNGTEYFFTVFARKDTSWSAGVSDSATPNLVEEAVAGDLIITEVSGDDSDGTNNDNGYMEIYNRSNKIINLSNIEARYYNSNPGSSSDEVTLSGTLSPGSFIIVTQNGGNYTTEYSDTADAAPGGDFFFNGGDDGCDVYHTTNGVIDQFNDNGSGQSPWNWNDNFTYKRNSSDSGAIQANWTADGTNNNPRTKTNLYFWTGDSDTSWTNTGNWDEGAAPSSTTDVVITDQTNEPSITSSVEVSNFTIETNTDVVVEKTGNLEATGNLNNNGTLSLESDSNEYSSLIINGTSNGTINYDRHVNINGSGDTGSNDLISAPLTGQAFNNFVLANGNILNNGTLYLFGPFDKTTGEYVTFAGTATTTLEPGIGYRAGSTDNGTFTFTGTVNNGDVDVTIENSGPNEAEWNLIGNPYPSYLNVQDFLNHEVGGVSNLSLFQSGSAAIYGYDGNALDGWVVYNLANTNEFTVLAPGQGFFVSSANTSATVQFTAAMRSTGTTDDFIAGRNAELMFVKLNASTNSDSFSTDFYFNTNASQGFDFGYDAQVWGETTPDFAIYSHLVEDNQGKAIALQALNASDLSNVSIPLGVNANQGEQLTFSIAEMTLPDSINVYLDDVVANTSTLLNTGDYVITPTTSLSGTGRFFLRTSEDALSTIDNNLDTTNIFALNSTKELVVNGQLQENTRLELYDIQGRKVLSTQLDSSSLENRIDASALSAGVYVVTVENNGQQKTQKVILK